MTVDLTRTLAKPSTPPPLPGGCRHCGPQAIRKINPSVSPDDIKRHEEWLKVYGSS